MAVTKKIIGRIPICFGTWYAKQGGWGVKNRVTLYGSEFESLHENNTVPPAVYDEIENTVTFNENDWRVISNGTEAWLADAKIDALGTWKENPEFVEVKLDANDCVLWGIRKDGDIVFGCGIPSKIQNALNKIIKDIDDNFGDIRNTFHYVTSSEYIFACLDAKDRFLYGVTVEGKFRAADLEFELPEEEAKWLNTIFSLIQDPEHLEITVDSEDKMLSWRDNEGVKHETNLKVENKLELSNEAMTDFQQALKDTGFQPGGGGDWSDKNEIQIPEPKLAFVNITGIDSMPVAKGTNAHAILEVYDGAGNYFKKKGIVDLQGDSSSYMAKKNFAVDFCEDEWEGDDTTDIKIGSWVNQDSFHFKAYYTSMFKTECPIGYKIWDMMRKTRGFDDDAPYKEYYAESYSTTDAGIGDNLEQNVGTGARTIPDGFPCIVHLNGEFYGIFIWQLKKHRDNMAMDRNDTVNIHIEGEMGFSEFWDGSIIWDFPGTTEGVEIRNPKPKKSKWTLLCQDGTTYDFDAGRRVPMTTRPDNYDELDDQGKKNCDNTIKVTQNIQTLADFITEITPFETQYNNNEITLDEFKEEMEKRMSMSWLMDYLLLVCFIQDGDSVRKNWQWTTWGKIDNTLKWFVCPYDLDSAFGVSSTFAWPISAPAQSWFGRNETPNTPAYYVWKYYMPEMKARYAELRQAGVFNYDTVFGLFTSWIERIGYSNYKKEYKKWPDSPCNRDNNVNENWEQVGLAYGTYTFSGTNWNASKSYALGANCKYKNKYYTSKVANNKGHVPSDSTYWNDMMVKPGTYSAGTTVIDGKTNFYTFRAKNEVTIDAELNNRPFNSFYSTYPFEGGSYDSIYRIGHWIKEKIRLMDSQMEYNN